MFRLRAVAKAARPLAPRATFRAPVLARAFAAGETFENPVAKRKAAEKQLEADLAQLQKEFEAQKAKQATAPPAETKRREGLQLFGDAGKLAHTLMDAAIASKADLRKVNADLQKFQAMLDHEKKLQDAQEKVIPDTPEGIEKLAAEQLKKAPTLEPTLTGTVRAGPVSPQNKIKYLQEKFFPMLKASGDQLLPLVENFICMLLEQKKFDKVYKKVIANFDELMLDHLKEVRGVVTSTEVLPAATLAKIEAKLKAQLEPGQTLTLQTQVDPSILGGLVINLGSKAQDLSARYAIKRVEQALRSTSAGEP